MDNPIFRTRNTERSRELRRASPPAERKLWSQLRAGQLNGHRFTKQFQVGSYFVDFVCREKKLVVEVDGWSHDARQGYDGQRDRFIRSKGYEVLRFTNEQVMLNLDGVLVMIRERLAAIPSPNPSRPREGS